MHVHGRLRPEARTTTGVPDRGSESSLAAATLAPPESRPLGYSIF